ncbi:MAG: Trm112 family protein [Deltaproteobacteria bacterium]|nr:Trm112 family protein [Deltaproteobacteria bacterium]
MSTEKEVKVSEELLEILACPECKGKLEKKEGSGLLCPACKLLFAVKDGIPVMLVSEATRLSE